MSHALATAAHLVRRTRAIDVVCAVTCVLFATHAVAEVVDDGPIDAAIAVTARAWDRVALTRRAPAAPVPDDPQRGERLIDRNMFCSECVAAVAAPVAETGEIPVTALPIVLLATSLGDDSFATVRDGATGAQGAYGIGDRLRGAGPIERIAGTSIQFRNEALGRSERVELLTALVSDQPQPQAAAVVTPPPEPAQDEAWIHRVKQTGDKSYEVERSLVRELIASGTGAKVKGVRVGLASKDGKLNGVRIAKAQPGSLATAIGLQTGDVIEAIDGVRLTSPDQLLEVMARVNSATRVPVRGTRNGQPLDLEYSLR
jgi:type II secretion system protein C